MSDPTTRELLERIKKLDAVTSQMADELTRQRADIEEILRVIDFMAKRFETIQTHMKMLFRAERNHDQRLIGLEQKVFPTMWKTIDRAENIVGDLYQANEDNPLDRRMKEP